MTSVHRHSSFHTHTQVDRVAADFPRRTRRYPSSSNITWFTSYEPPARRYSRARDAYHPSAVRSHAVNSTTCSARVFVARHQAPGPVHSCWWQKRTTHADPVATTDVWNFESRHPRRPVPVATSSWLYCTPGRSNAEHDIPKTAVTTPFGLFEFPVMCFGLRNAAQTFQRVVNEMLRGLDYAFAYIDDVLIASLDELEHEQHVHSVLKRLQEFGMSINPAKCVFSVTSLTFLGHVINKDSCQPNPDRVDTIHR